MQLHKYFKYDKCIFSVYKRKSNKVFEPELRGPVLTGANTIIHSEETFTPQASNSLLVACLVLKYRGEKYCQTFRHSSLFPPPYFMSCPIFMPCFVSCPRNLDSKITISFENNIECSKPPTGKSSNLFRHLRG